jgi:hypothetical protein
MGGRTEMSFPNDGDTQRWAGITKPYTQSDVDRLRGVGRLEGWKVGAMEQWGVE